MTLPVAQQDSANAFTSRLDEQEDQRDHEDRIQKRKDEDERWASALPDAVLMCIPSRVRITTSMSCVGIAGTEDDFEQRRRPRSDRRGGGRNRGGGGAGILTGHPQNRLRERCPFALSGFFVH